MSDSYQAVIVCGVQPHESSALAGDVITRLAADGIIQTSADSYSILGNGIGYRPGPNVESLYKLGANEGAFWTLKTNGVEVCTDRWINQLGFSCIDGFSCPLCAAFYPLDDHLVADRFVKAIGSYLDGRDELEVLCPACNAPATAPLWKTTPHLGFANLAFQFWNWPPLDGDSWKVDIPALIAQASGHDTLLTYGRL